MPNISFDTLTEFAISLLSAGGATKEEAAIVGPSLATANLRGYSSHGVMRIPFYLDMLKNGEIRSGVKLDVISETESSIATDANWGFGRLQAGRLLNQLVTKAQAHGVAVGTIRNCAHAGRLGEYCEIAANEHGLVSMAMVNTHGAARRVAPPGGIRPRLGTNPLAMGVPNDDAPVILDFSTSATAEGKVRVKNIAGEEVPDGWLIDKDGLPTNDPSTLYGDPPGTILPMGGPQAYKGFGLALMIDIFTGALSGGLCARETPITPKGNCVFFILIDPNHLGGGDAFAQEVTNLLAFVRGCPTREGVDEIILPGDPEKHNTASMLAGGVKFDQGNWDKLLALGDTLGVSPPPCL
ncbi:MAG: dehydrogenase [Rhodopirellula sp.]|nr:dehydrogenase [Rhodopirellula sp.]